MNYEMLINYQNAHLALAKIDNLRKESVYKIYMTSELMNLSSGRMADQVNLMQRELEQVETELMTVIDNTCKALCIGMKEFISADNEMAKLISIRLNEIAKDIEDKNA